MAIGRRAVIATGCRCGSWGTRRKRAARGVLAVVEVGWEETRAGEKDVGVGEKRVCGEKKQKLVEVRLELFLDPKIWRPKLFWVGLTGGPCG